MIADRPWSLPVRFAFRFAFAYWLLVFLPTPFDLLPWIGEALGTLESMWREVVPAFGAHVLGLREPITTFTNGSGDTTYDWAKHLLCLLLAVAGATIWSILDRRPAHPRLAACLRLYLRLTLAVTLWSYGWAKILPEQFPAQPLLERLIQTYGQSSPMGLLWTFMAASRPYTFFVGVLEALAALLLIFGRTSLLGALLAAIAMTQVVALNFCYDVPVKLLSSHLLLAAVFLLLPDLRRLIDFLVLDRPTAARPVNRALPLRWQRFEALGFVAFALVLCGWVIWQDGLRVDEGPLPPLYGLYLVESLTRDGKSDPSVRRLIVNERSHLVLQLHDDSLQRWRVEVELEPGPLRKGRLTVRPRYVGPEVSTLTIEELEPSRFRLDGTFDAQQFSAVIIQEELPRFLLVERGFHWINETPFNR